MIRKEVQGHGSGGVLKTPTHLFECVTKMQHGGQKCKLSLVHLEALFKL